MSILLIPTCSFLEEFAWFWTAISKSYDFLDNSSYGSPSCDFWDNVDFADSEVLVSRRVRVVLDSDFERLRLFGQ